MYVSCRGLKNLDVLSKSDPYVIIYTKQNKEFDQWKILGQTEVAKNNLNPDFVKAFEMFYQFERHQYLRFVVQDSDDGSNPDEIGHFECTLGQIAGSRGMSLESELRLIDSDDQALQKQNRGKIQIKVSPLQKNNWELFLKINATDLPASGNCLCFPKTNPQIEICRTQGDIESGVSDNFSVYKSQQASVNSRSFQFKPIRIAGGLVCNNQSSNPILFKFSNSVQEKEEIIGKVQASIDEMKVKKQFGIVNDQGTQNGLMKIQSIDVRDKPSFLGYIKAGWEISFLVAIDYTLSNGNPNSASSLHTNTQFNPYQRAILSVGGIIENYDSDKCFPVYGFGGIPTHMNKTSTSHCFPLNGSQKNSEIKGCENILAEYTKQLSIIQQSAPTVFLPILEEVEDIAKDRLGKKVYNILLILTDGEIGDMPEVQNKIVKMSKLPISIIIIGLGSGSFHNMQVLDGDQQVLRNTNGEPGVRDIVQFVKFLDYEGNDSALAAEVLKEIPEQFLAYADYKGFKQ
eukprot:403359029